MVFFDLREVQMSLLVRIEFLPQSVPFYAATQNFLPLRS